MIVVDASLVVTIILNEPESGALWARLRDRSEPLAAPDVLVLEVLQVLRRLTLPGRISQTHASAALFVFEALPIERFDHAPLKDRIWALRENLTAYDGAYVALAEALGAELWTRDARIAAAPVHQARVILV